VAPVLELGAIADSGNNRGSRFRADAFAFGDPLAGLALEKYQIALFVERGDPAVGVTDKIVELRNRFARQIRQFIHGLGENLGDLAPKASGALCHRDSAIDQQPTDLTDDGGAVIDHALTDAVERLGTHDQSHG